MTQKRKTPNSGLFRICRLYDNSRKLFMARDWNYFGPFGSIWAHWGIMGPNGALKSDHWGYGSVHTKFEPVASHGDPFRANLVPSTSTLYQVLGTKYLVPSTWYHVLGTKYFLVPSTWY